MQRKEVFVHSSHRGDEPKSHQELGGGPAEEGRLKGPMRATREFPEKLRGCEGFCGRLDHAVFKGAESA